MASRSLTSLAALGLFAIAGCGDGTAHRTTAGTGAEATDAAHAPTRVDALRADAEVAAAAGDPTAARRFLNEALALEPRNETLRDRLLALGGTPPLITDSILLAAESTRTPVVGPVATAVSPAPNPPEPTPGATVVAPLSTGTVAAAPTVAAPPASTSGDDARVPRRVASATRRSVRPTSRVAAGAAGAARPTVTTNGVIGGEVAVAPRPAPADAPPPPTAPAAVDAPASSPAALAAPMELADLADADVAAPHATTAATTLATTTAAAAPAHKRTWPWTRAQRWLVAKGIGAGTGAGVVVGAIIGNVPGALLVGSLGGGAVGFKKATEIGPADPYPDQKKVAEFEAKHRGAKPTPTVASVPTAVVGEAELAPRETPQP